MIRINKLLDHQEKVKRKKKEIQEAYDNRFTFTPFIETKTNYSGKVVKKKPIGPIEKLLNSVKEQ